MHRASFFSTACRSVLPVLAAASLALSGSVANSQISNLPVRAMAANTTSGNDFSYQTAGINIFKGLKPDIVAIQEFRYNGSTNDAQIRMLVDTAFGPDFHFYKEAGDQYIKPNGIVSRWPIIEGGSWDDPEVPDRGFAWAQIDLPGTNDLYVVSVHLYNSGSATERNNEATTLKSHILANFPAGAWILVGGDCNTDNRSEVAIDTFKSFLSDSPIPTDAHVGGDPDTNEGRSKPYDYLFPSFSLTNYQVPVVFPSRTYTKGLVFDSEVFATNAALDDVWPVAVGDSHVSGMQHMPVIKDFLLPVFGTNSVSDPAILTHPQSRTNVVGTQADFFVAASGTAPLSYQWRVAGTNIVGAVATNYTIGSVQTNHAGNYTVVVTNSSGSITSSVATLTVVVPPTNTLPVITNQPASRTNTAGSTADFSVIASGTEPLAYQWRFNGTTLSSATNSTYSKPNVQTNDAGPYTVVITNVAGAVTSSPAVLFVMPAGTNSHSGVLAGWDMNGLSGFGPSPMAPTTNAANLVVAGFTRGSGVTTNPTAAQGGWGGNGFGSPTSSAAITADDYVTFAIMPDAGYHVSFSSISTFKYRRSSSGPAKGLLQYQAGSDAFADIAIVDYTSTSSSGAALEVMDLSGIPELQEVGAGTNVTFRIVNYGTNVTTGTWYLFDVGTSTALDFAVTGTVAPDAPAGSSAIAPTLLQPGLAGSQLVFQLTGTPASNYIIQVSTNAAASNWLTVETNAAPFWFTNPTSAPQQFFRGAVAP